MSYSCVIFQLNFLKGSFVRLWSTFRVVVMTWLILDTGSTNIFVKREEVKDKKIVKLHRNSYYEKNFYNEKEFIMIPCFEWLPIWARLTHVTDFESIKVTKNLFKCDWFLANIPLFPLMVQVKVMNFWQKNPKLWQILWTHKRA